MNGSILSTVTLALSLALESCTRAHVDVRDIKIYRSSQPLMEKVFGSFRIAARVTNNSTTPLVLPTFHVHVKSAGITSECVAEFFLAPGNTCYLVTGGISYQLDVMRGSNFAEVTFVDNDWYTPKEYVAYQLKNLLLMSLTIISTTFYSTNDSCSVKAQFENRTGKTVTLVEGTAVFLDANDRILDAYPFVFTPPQSGFIDMWIADVPGAANAHRCVLQISHFRDTSQSVPDSVPPLPSVH